MLRGAFGFALRNTVCVMSSRQLCSDCILKRQCANTKIFETLIFDRPPRFLRGLETAPRPFVLDCEMEKLHFREGEDLEFTMTLIGNAQDYHPYIIYAVHRMGERGLGAKRYPFFLRKAFYKDKTGKWRELYDGSRQQLEANPEPLEIPGTNGKEKAESVKIEFITPTRLKFNNEYSMEFNFRMLLFKLIRRVLELAYFYAPDSQINWEFHHLLVKASKVDIIRSHLHWIDIDRYSNRQKTALKLGGFVGKITLQGNLIPFLPILRASEILNVGKGTTFGLGKIKVKVLAKNGE